MSQRAWILLLLACAAPIAAAPARTLAEEPLFTGAFVDGTYVTGGRLTEWHDVNAQPKLNGTWIFDPNKPIRWLRNESTRSPTLPDAFVEFVGGDRLPGRIIEYRHQSQTYTEQAPPHLIIQLDSELGMPDRSQHAPVRVKTETLRKVVWQHRTGGRYTPGRIYYSDGRELAFRSLRWTEGGIHLLTNEGTRKASFQEIAELHFPQGDPWETYYATLAALTPQCTARLMRLETYDGLAATTSSERFQARTVSGDPAGWYHMLMPAWSLDPIWVQHTTVLSRYFFMPQEVPLSLIEPQQVVQRSSFGSAWSWRADASVQGKALRSGNKTFGWGLGTHAHCELMFSLPDCVRAFRSRLGLDEAAGRGGCVRARVHLNGNDQPAIYQSELIVGSQQVHDSGTISLAGPSQNQKSLVLVTDSAANERPSGADPFDIRDSFDWLEPQLELDPEQLRAAVYRLLPAVVPAWASDGWSIADESKGRLTLVNRLEKLDENHRRYHFESVPKEGNLILSKRVKLQPQHKYLCLAVGRFSEGTTSSKVEVRINRRPVYSMDVPQRRQDVSLEPMLIPLERFHGQQVELEIEHFPSDEKGLIVWETLRLVESTSATAWIPLEAKELTSAGGAKLAKESDRSILVSEKTPDFDNYKIVAETDLQGITAVRLEVLPDSRLPNNGPGRAANGNYVLTDFRLKAARRATPDQAEPVAFETAAADFSNRESPVEAAIDDSLQTGWSTHAQHGQPHVAVFNTQQDLGYAGGTVLTFELDHKVHQQHAIGRFRLSVTQAARPVVAERPGVIVPLQLHRALTIFADEAEFVAQLNQGSGQASLESVDKYSGTASIKIQGEQRFNDALPGLKMKIRENPGPGEYRYLCFAWKKSSGQSICLQLNHNGLWGPTNGNAAKFRYHAGPGPECFGASLRVGDQLPNEWTLVKRDLFADFGEFTLHGLALSSVDGEYALFDQILLARNLQDFEPWP